MMDLLLIWGVIFAPMTALRVFKFGPGECLLIIWMCFLLFARSRKQGGFPFSINEMGKYQLANLLMMLVGMFVNLVLYGEYKGLTGVSVDILSHFFMFLLVSTLISYFSQRKIEDINSILAKIVRWGAVVYATLLFYALFVSSSLFGVSLWMGGKSRFLGLALNPHQIGMITGFGLFFSLYIMSITKNTAERIKYTVAAAVWFWISLSLKSDTMAICYIVCITLLIYLKIPKIQRDPVKRRNSLIIFSFVCIIVGILFTPWIIEKLLGFISTAGNGLGRVELWVNSLEQFIDRPVCFFTGFGPGGQTGMYMVVSGNEMESHNTYVQLILNSGIFICMYYIITILGIIKKPYTKNSYLVLAVVFFLLYGCGGNMNRRSLVWFTYTMCWLLFRKTAGTEASLK